MSYVGERRYVVGGEGDRISPMRVSLLIACLVVGAWGKDSRSGILDGQVCFESCIVPARELPEHPRVVTMGFVVTHGLLLGSTYADAKTTTTFLHSPVGCHEESPFLGRRPRDGRVYGTLVGAAVSLTVVDYFVERGLLRRGHGRLAKWWRVVPLSYAVGHSVYAYRNGGCF